MNAKDLIIGNTIEYNFPTEEAVEKWEDITIQWEDIQEFSEVGVHESYRPKQVTKEWLKQKGFYQDLEEPSYRWFYGQYIKYDIDDFGICFIDIWNFPKKQYCHELENFIYAVTGKEL
jgi:hypothetical protein